MRSRIKQTNSSNHNHFFPLASAYVASAVLLATAMGAGLFAGRSAPVAPPAREGKVTKSSNLPGGKTAAVCTLGTNLIMNAEAEADTAAVGDGSADQDVSAWENETG